MIISSREIHLWYAYDEQICDSQLLSRYHHLLNEEESGQQKRFHFEKTSASILDCSGFGTNCFIAIMRLKFFLKTGSSGKSS